MVTKRGLINGKFIEIAGAMPRHKIVKTVVNTFIATEYRKKGKGKGVQFIYHVEILDDGSYLSISRPTRKYDFDFFVNIVIADREHKLGVGKHEEIIKDIRDKFLENSQRCNELLEAIKCIYKCKENDVNRVMIENDGLSNAFNTGISASTLLKILKWLFIMEDIFYWNYEGRAFLYNFIRYALYEKDQIRYNLEVSKGDKGIKGNPDKLKKLMMDCGIDWEKCEG